MSMMFIEVKTALKSILETGAAGAFDVVGTIKKSINAENQLQIPRVMVNFETSRYPSEGSSFQIERDSTLNYSIKVTAALPCYVDLDVINDPGSTDVQRATALSEVQDSVDSVNDLINLTSERVYQIIEDARNYDLGFPKGTVRDRHIGDITVNEAQKDGQLTVATALINFSCKVTESVSGEDGIPAVVDDVADGSIKPNEENTDNAGVIS